MDLSTEGFFFDGNFDNELEGFNFHSTVLSDVMWKKFELLETPPLSPSQHRDEAFASSPFGWKSFGDITPVGLASSSSSSSPETPPDSEDEHEQPLAGEDLMWSSSSTFPATINGLTSSAGTTKNVQLKYKLNEESATEKFSQFPYPLNDALSFVQRPTALKRPADSEGEEEVDVVSVEPQSRIQPCTPQTSAPSSVSTSDEGGSVTVTAPVPLIQRPPPPQPSLPTRPPAAKRIRRERSTAGRLSSFDADDSDESKRATHNVLERRRREDLKLLYTNLRRTLPDLVTNERAAKVKILEHAFAHVEDLKNTQLRLQRTLAEEERRNVYLHSHLATVRAKAAKVM